jgi:uncharacterized membrane-anchored protein YitT (DUF2179 family)
VTDSGGPAQAGIKVLRDMRRKAGSYMAHPRLWSTLRDYMLLTVGGLLMAANLNLFLAPSNIAPGGVSGSAIIIHEVTRILFCTVSRPHERALRNIVAEVDPSAFVVTGHGHQASGGTFGQLQRKAQRRNVP